MTSATQSAFTLLTIFRLPGSGRFERETAGRTMALAPFVGLALGVVVALVVVAFRVFTKPPGGPPTTLLPAVVGIGLLALLTRGLHLDGLADVADGLGAGGGRERMLAVMREPTIGVFGAVTVLFVVLIQITALSWAIGQHRGSLSLLVAAMAGRLAATLACTPGTPAARPDGLGAMVAGSVRPRHAVAAVTGVIVVAALVGRFDIDGGDVGRSVRAVCAVLVALGVAHLVRRRLIARLGGITGDVLGVLVEVAATVSLVVMVMDLPHRLRDALGIPT